MEIHDALDKACQRQPDAELTLTDRVPPALETESLAGDKAYVHAGCDAAWETVTVEPATVSVPVRAALPIFGATMNVKVPEPDPETPGSTVIQLALLAAVQAQPGPVVTVTVEAPP